MRAFRLAQKFPLLLLILFVFANLALPVWAATGQWIIGYAWEGGNSKQYAFVDGNGHIQELFVTPSGTWQQTDLTQRIQTEADRVRNPNDPPVVAASPAPVGASLVGYSWEGGNSKQYAFVDGNGHIQELFVTPSGSWQQLDLTQLIQTQNNSLRNPQASTAPVGASLVGYSWEGGNSKQYAFVDGNGHIQELFVTPSGSWQQLDLTQLIRTQNNQFRNPGASTAPVGASLVGYSWEGGNSKQYAFVDDNGHIQELFVTPSGTWQQTDLTQRIQTEADRIRNPNEPPVVAASPAPVGASLVGFSWEGGHSKQYAFVDDNGHIQELFVTTSGSWQQLDLTRLIRTQNNSLRNPQASTAPVGASLVGYAWEGGNSKQYAFVDSNGHIQELFATPSGVWQQIDLTQLIRTQNNSSRNPNASAAPVGASLVGYAWEGGNTKQYAFVDDNGHIQELFVTPSGVWQQIDLTQLIQQTWPNASTAPVALMAKALTGRSISNTPPSTIYPQELNDLVPSRYALNVPGTVPLVVTNLGYSENVVGSEGLHKEPTKKMSEYPDVVQISLSAVFTCL